MIALGGPKLKLRDLYGDETGWTGFNESTGGAETEKKALLRVHIFS